MLRKALFFLLLSVCPVLGAQESVGTPSMEIITIRRESGQLHLVVPESFQGRTGKETEKGFSVQIFRRVEYSRADGQLEMKGRVNRFDMHTSRQSVKGMVWNSSRGSPGKEECLKCHGFDPSFSRTQIWIGEENRALDPEIIRSGPGTFAIPSGHVLKSFLEICRQSLPGQKFKIGISQGKISSGNLSLQAKSGWLTWDWQNSQNFSFLSEFRFSKAKGLDLKREITGTFEWKPKKHFSVSLLGGILLEGFGHYDVGFSNVGSILAATQIKTPEDLPSLFQKLKDKNFGYYLIKTSYEYVF